MSILVLRFANSLMSFGGYRHQVNIGTAAPTASLPRKSAVAGLLGAALGPIDHGAGSARQLNELTTKFDLDIRVEQRNPTTEDFQVLGPLPTVQDTTTAERSLRIANANTERFPSKRGKGNFETTVGRRDFLAHSEFIVALTSTPDLVTAWRDAISEPIFMPYLGRKSCAPTFPFLLGIFDGHIEDLFNNLPHVDPHAWGKPEAKTLIAHNVTGNYDTHDTQRHPTTYQPRCISREQQLEWAKENLQ